MINLTVKQLKPGMVTAQGIYNTAGGSYLTRGMPITKSNIARLKKLGISNVAVTSLSTTYAPKPPPDIIDDATRVRAIHQLHDIYQGFETTGSIDVKALEKTSEGIIHDILANRRNLVQLTDLRNHDDYTFAHSVNVTVLSVMLGALCHLSKEDQLILAMGGLLHDLGKINVPLKILSKRGTLTDDEFSVIREHPGRGQDKISKLPIPHADILAKIAGQHHEHLDGRGYPKRLKAKSIHRFARIVAIADVYDALTTKRSYKPAYKPHIAYKIMKKCSVGQFDETLLDLFFNNVAVYPIGTVLRVSDGYAVVREVRFGESLSPKCVLFATASQKLLEVPQALDLSACPPGTIQSVVEDMEILTLCNRLKFDPSCLLDES